MDIKKRVLLVEDEADIRSIYAEILTEAGFEVIQAADGETGLKLATTEAWDILLLDIMLPGEDGIHVLKAIKTHPELTKRPILLLTNLENETIITECFDMGADGYLIKSEITPDYIVTEVKNFI